MTIATHYAGLGPVATLDGRSGVIILNASYERLGSTSVKHAVKMLARQVALVEEAEEGRTIGPFRWPRVIRLLRYVAPKWLFRKQARYSRSGVLIRDRHRCCYCGGCATTVDHVLPSSRGGASGWLNLVASCEPCNGRKRDRTPTEAGMRMLFEPFVPSLAHQGGV
ncbi:MAG: HNH endonuclease [Nocardioides sp.]